MTAHRLALMIGSAVIGASAVIAGCARAEGFTGTQFLEWPIESQNSYFQSSATMSVFIASRNDPEQATCLNDWYYDDNAVNPDRNDEFRAAIRENPTYHPSGVVLAVMQKACGSFEYHSKT